MSFKLVKTRGTRNPPSQVYEIILIGFLQKQNNEKIKEKLSKQLNEGNVVQTS